MSNDNESKDGSATQKEVGHRHVGRKWLVMLMMAAILVAGWLWQREQKRSFGVEIVGYNHTNFGIDFYVDGHMGGGIAAHGGGGSHVCCVAIPAHYKPGMTVKILWKSTVESPDGNAFKTQEVAVPTYDAHHVAVFAVHFLKDGQIKAFGTDLTLEHPDYPIKDPR